MWVSFTRFFVVSGIPYVLYGAYSLIWDGIGLVREMIVVVAVRFAMVLVWW